MTDNRYYQLLLLKGKYRKSNLAPHFYRCSLKIFLVAGAKNTTFSIIRMQCKILDSCHKDLKNYKNLEFFFQNVIKYSEYLLTLVFARLPSKSKAAILAESWSPSPWHKTEWEIEMQNVKLNQYLPFANTCICYCLQWTPPCYVTLQIKSTPSDYF